MFSIQKINFWLGFLFRIFGFLATAGPMSFRDFRLAGPIDFSDVISLKDGITFLDTYLG